MAYFYIKTSDEIVKIKGDDFEVHQDDCLQIMLDRTIVAMFRNWEYFYAEEIK